MMKQMDRKKAPKSHWYSNVSSISNRLPGGGLFHILSQMLLMASMSEATGPRDKVYGISAFIVRLHVDMEVPAVDYTRSIAETYEDFAVCMMRSTGWLWPLEHIVKPSREEIWPSWVPDLLEAGGIAYPQDWCKGFQWSPKLEEYESLTGNLNGRLRVRGRRMACVSRIYAQMPRLPADRPEETKTEHDILRFECLDKWTACAVKLDREANPEVSSLEREGNGKPY